MGLSDENEVIVVGVYRFGMLESSMFTVSS